ncbi:hypothetical protein MTO96_028953 [Rhipicephalus appendiculatus]
MLFAGRYIEGKDLDTAINGHLGEREHCRGLIEKNMDVAVIFVQESIINQEIKDYIKEKPPEDGTYGSWAYSAWCASCAPLASSFSLSSVSTATTPQQPLTWTGLRLLQKYRTISSPPILRSWYPAIEPRNTHSSSTYPTIARKTQPATQTLKSTPITSSSTEAPTTTVATTVTTTAATTEATTEATTASVTDSGTVTGLLLCTVGDEISTYIQMPNEKLCRYVFYESVEADSTSTITGDLGPAQEFVDLAKGQSSAKFGISFFPRKNSEFLNSFMDAKFRMGLDSLWQSKITHFGALNIYGNLVDLGILRQVLLALKFIYGYLAPKATTIRSPVMALGVAPDNIDELVYLPELMMTEYLPHLFVSIAHLPSADTLSPKCNDSIELLQQVASVTNLTTLALAFTLRARRYEVENPDPLKPKTSSYFPFMLCKKNSMPSFRPPASFCSDQELSRNYLYNSRLHVSFTYSKASEVTVTFDSERALRSKICDTKPNAVTLPYHIAAYDIDYDASWSSACVFLTLRGPYHRLKLLCKLEQLLLTEYTPADCRTRDIHMSSDNCDP